MSVKIAHPPVPNICQSQIAGLQKFAESKNKLRAFMLAQRITRQQNLGNLEDLYKPILNNQSKQISEVQTSSTQDITEQTDVKQIDDDSGIGTASSISAMSEPPPINYSNSKIYQEQAARVFKSIQSDANKNILSNVNGYLNAYYPINDNNTSITESGKSLVISYIINTNIDIDQRLNPWRTINADKNSTFFDDLDDVIRIHQKDHSGTGIKLVRFLPSDPKVLINKLKILLAERDAGNNNVFDEISAIADEFRRTGI